MYLHSVSSTSSSGPGSVYLESITKHDSAFNDACFSTAWSSDGRRYAVASQDGTVKVWDVRSSKPYETFVGMESVSRRRKRKFKSMGHSSGGRRQETERMSISSMSSLVVPGSGRIGSHADNDFGLPSSVPTSSTYGGRYAHLRGRKRVDVPDGLEVREEDGAQFMIWDNSHQSSTAHSAPYWHQYVGSRPSSPPYHVVMDNLAGGGGIPMMGGFMGGAGADGSGWMHPPPVVVKEDDASVEATRSVKFVDVGGGGAGGSKEVLIFSEVSQFRSFKNARPSLTLFSFDELAHRQCPYRRCSNVQ